MVRPEQVQALVDWVADSASSTLKLSPTAESSELAPAAHAHQSFTSPPAFELGKLTHMPCLAHVFNLLVQWFLKTYPNLPELLVKVRRVCAHFRNSKSEP